MAFRSGIKKSECVEPFVPDVKLSRRLVKPKQFLMVVNFKLSLGRAGILTYCVERMTF